MTFDMADIAHFSCVLIWSLSQNFDGEDEHVHLLVNYPPKVAVSRLVNSLKGVSSHLIRKKDYPGIRKKLWGNALWSPSALSTFKLRRCSDCYYSSIY